MAPDTADRSLPRGRRHVVIWSGPEDPPLSSAGARARVITEKSRCPYGRRHRRRSTSLVVSPERRTREESGILGFVTIPAQLSVEGRTAVRALRRPFARLPGSIAGPIRVAVSSWSGEAS